MNDNSAEDKKFKGTTTVGIVYDKGVILAAEKRATMGTFIASKDVEKILPVGDRIAITTAGGVGDAQSLARLLRAELEMYKYSSGEALSIQGSATLLANVLQGSKYFPYIVQIIIGGYDTAPRLFDVDLFGGLLEEKYTSTGSGSIVAYGVLDDGFKEGMKEEDAVELAKRAIRAAIKRDSASGEGIDVVAISRDSIKKYKTAPVIPALS
jgi:proteasome beta subunit